MYLIFPFRKELWKWDIANAGNQDTLVQCFNYIYKQEEQYQDFQYILTLNRDKIENEEQRKLIQMDIDEHQIAVFTKEKKFLGRNYHFLKK